MLRWSYLSALLAGAASFLTLVGVGSVSAHPVTAASAASSTSCKILDVSSNDQIGNLDGFVFRCNASIPQLEVDVEKATLTSGGQAQYGATTQSCSSQVGSDQAICSFSTNGLAGPPISANTKVTVVYNVAAPCRRAVDAELVVNGTTTKVHGPCGGKVSGEARLVSLAGSRKKVRATLACPIHGASCVTSFTGKADGKTVISHSVTEASAAYSTVTVKLNAAGSKLLARHHSLRVNVTLSDRNTGVRISHKTVTVT